MTESNREFWRGVHQAEVRLAVSFPSSIEAAAGLDRAARLGWRLWPPHEWTRVSSELSGWDYGGPRGTFDERGYRGPEGVVIGGNDAGNVVCLLATGRSPDLGEAVFHWDHETAEFTQLAARMSELPELLEGLADSLLPAHSVDSASSRVSVVATDDICRFCGTERRGRTRCGVCSRDVDEQPENDASENLAAQLLLTLVREERLDLEQPSEFQHLCSGLAQVLDACSGPDEAAQACCCFLLEDPAVRDLFADDREVARLLRTLAAGGGTNVGF